MLVIPNLKIYKSHLAGVNFNFINNHFILHRNIEQYTLQVSPS